MNRKIYCLIILGALCISVNASPVSCNRPIYIRCDNGKCVSSLFECDGEDDCGDSTDERNCHNFTLSLNVPLCAKDEFQCQDRACIPIEKFCDNIKDCPDSTDEYNGCVAKLKCPAFRCNDGHCLRKEWVCDGIADCPDKSDETKCDTKVIPTEECNSTNDRFLCKNQRCIFLGATCNKKDDCGDWSDENVPGCAKAEEECTKMARCNQFCRRTPTGAACSCQPGYKLVTNETCKDVNECKIYGTCDQQCINNDGAYACTCRSGYTLQEDKKTCKVEGGEALMVFSSKSEIRGYYLNSKMYYPIVRNLQRATTVSLDANYVYWADNEDGIEAIFRSREDGSHREVILSAGLGKPENIAVEWVTGNIYFADSIHQHIGVCTNNGSYCTVLIKAQSGNPRGLALLPSNGILYWSEWDLFHGSHISMAGMDGKDIVPFITSNLGWPNELTIDYANERLYWADGRSRIIESVLLDGTDRRIVLSDIAKHPFSLAIFENKLYWSDWTTDMIMYCDKNTGKDWNILVRQNSTVYGIHIYHSVLKPKMRNPCSEQPCSQLCLLNRRNGYTCACTLDRELSPDQHTCRVLQKKEHILIAAGSKIIDYYHEILGTPKIADSILMRHVTAMTYDSLTGSIFASDQLADKIFHYDPRNGNAKSIISLKNEALGGMDFDYIGNNLYLTDIVGKSIEVHSLSTNEKTVFYLQVQPHDIALVPNKGLMFIVFYTERNYGIMKMQMNGVGASFTIIAPTLTGPKISLCYDKNTDRIFWSDQGTGSIESVALDGTDKYLHRTGLTAPVDLMVLSERIFWTQYKSNHLYWTDKNSTYHLQKRVALPNVPEGVTAMQLVTIQGGYVTQDHACHRNNGNCSHVCLVSNINFHTCACPPNMMLSADNRTCSTENACALGEVKCGNQNACVKRNQLCDGIDDCPNGEDEALHCGYLHSCGREEFRCTNGDCISLKKRCNSLYDCTDRSDEEGCQKKECETNEFQCHDGSSCLSHYLICNGHTDCFDFSDEMNCDTYVCSEHDYTCKNKMCIPMIWKCDGEKDCSDGSDEGQHCKISHCSSEMFTCLNGNCLDAGLKCNGVNDCGDGSDEEQCFEHHNAHSANCTADQYNCYNTDICVSLKHKCNGVQDCPKNDDEHNCARCFNDEFACDNGNCIPQNWICDMTDDCSDGSDEKDCSGGNTKRNHIDTPFTCEEFRCDTGECLAFSMVCDGRPNCKDGSDEQGKCATACVKDNACQTKCYKTPNGPVCGCQSGFHLSDDRKSCEDVDECNTDPCSHICQNTVGSFMCTCYEGYVLRNDKTTCKATGQQMEMVTVVKNSIRRLTPTLSKIEIVHEDLNFDVSGVDVNAHENTICWSNDELGMITKMNLNTKRREIVTGVGRPCALAVDWSTNNVYFNDNALPGIKVCNLEQKKCANLLTLQVTMKPVSIAVDPKHGWLFWSQTSWPVYDDSSSEVYRTDLLGANMTTIAYRHVGVVSGLTIDHIRSRLYWSDSFLKSIEVADFDGSNRKTFMKTDYQPFSINLFEDSLYWLMGNIGQLHKCNIHGNKSCTTISIGITNIDRHFVILHPATQPTVQNACEGYICEYMCISRNNTPVCICENGYPDNSGNTCARSSNSSVKFASGTAHQKAAHIHQESSTVIGIVVTVIICIVALSAYCYYQRVKPNLTKKNDLSIRFQNPTYGRNNDIITPLNCMSSLPPGEHEYSNPIINISKYQKCGNNKKKGDFLCDDETDGESDSACKQNTQLIH